MLILPGAVVGVVVSFWDQQPRADSRFEQFEGYAAASMQSPNATDDHRADGGGHSRVEQGCLPAGEGRRGLRCGDGKVGYIHVGKTGGTTVVGYLTASSIGFTEYHTGGAPSLDDIRSHPRWLISVRDPIERLKSCFDWQNPQVRPRGSKSVASLSSRAPDAARRVAVRRLRPRRVGVRPLA